MWSEFSAAVGLGGSGAIWPGLVGSSEPVLVASIGHATSGHAAIGQVCGGAFWPGLGGALWPGCGAAFGLAESDFSGASGPGIWSDFIAFGFACCSHRGLVAVIVYLRLPLFSGFFGSSSTLESRDSFESSRSASMFSSISQSGSVPILLLHAMLFIVIALRGPVSFLTR